MIPGANLNNDLTRMDVPLDGGDAVGLDSEEIETIGFGIAYNVADKSGSGGGGGGCFIWSVGMNSLP